jgi:hypothetical protein
MLDEGAAAAAKVSAARTLKELFGEEQLGLAKPVSELTIAELDAEIALWSRLTSSRV